MYKAKAAQHCIQALTHTAPSLNASPSNPGVIGAGGDPAWGYWGSLGTLHVHACSPASPLDEKHADGRFCHTLRSHSATALLKQYISGIQQRVRYGKAVRLLGDL